MLDRCPAGESDFDPAIFQSVLMTSGSVPHPTSQAAPLLAHRFEDAAAGRGTELGLYKTAVGEIAQSLHMQFDAGVDATTLVAKRAAAVDRLLKVGWRAHVGPLAQEAALIAVGGYGRGELHPASDVDLLILVPEEADLSPIERFVTLTWDMGLDVGHSVRTVAECVESATDDVTIATNLMEARLIDGSRVLYEDMQHKTGPDAIWPSQQFFEHKRAEQTARHLRYHDTAYNLEPSVKGSPGGLRDIQMIGWVVKRHFRAETLEDLRTQGFLTAAEYETLIEGQTFLWQVRMALHLVAGRREDRLLFEHQREIAARFGFEDERHNLGVEQFMRQYYLTVMELSRLNEMLLELFQEVFLEAEDTPTIVALNRRFRTRNGFLEVTDDSVFRRYPFALLELFLLLQQNGDIKGVRASTIRLVRDHRYLIDDAFRSDLGCRSLFLEIIRQPRGITHEFRRMHTYGVLGDYLPEFGRVIGLMQFDLFHAYTVDEHILFTVRNLRQFFVPEHYHALPHCSDIVPRLPKPELLYLAGLFHDIAKGRGGNHSEDGAEDALEFCRHHGISHYDAQLVAWLVRNHLVMSTTAQRKDISDPEIIRDFASQVGDTSRLDYLYLLTVADIRATNPELWNDWKDSLLRDLFHSTRRALRRGLDGELVIEDLASECRDEARSLLFAEGFTETDFVDIWEEHSTDYFVRTRPEDVAWHTAQVIRHGDKPLPLVGVRTAGRGTEVFIYEDDKSHLFAATTAILERLGLTVMDARIFTGSNARTFDSYIVLEANGDRIEDGAREQEIRRTLRRRLADPEKAVHPVNRLPRRQLKSFPVKPRVNFERDEKFDRSIMEVTSADRPGLLSRIGWALVGSSAVVHNAKIATFGERAEDVFFVTGPSGGTLNDAECERIRADIVRALEPARKRTGDQPPVTGGKNATSSPSATG